MLKPSNLNWYFCKSLGEMTPDLGSEIYESGPDAGRFFFSRGGQIRNPVKKYGHAADIPVHSTVHTWPVASNLRMGYSANIRIRSGFFPRRTDPEPRQKNWTCCWHIHSKYLASNLRIGYSGILPLGDSVIIVITNILPVSSFCSIPVP
jgi:hypothetical protein